jgi:hypothetical protein
MPFDGIDRCLSLGTHGFAIGRQPWRLVIRDTSNGGQAATDQPSSVLTSASGNRFVLDRTNDRSEYGPASATGD